MIINYHDIHINLQLQLVEVNGINYQVITDPYCITESTKRSAHITSSKSKIVIIILSQKQNKCFVIDCHWKIEIMPMNWIWAINNYKYINFVCQFIMVILPFLQIKHNQCILCEIKPVLIARIYYLSLYLKMAA